MLVTTLLMCSQILSDPEAIGAGEADRRPNIPRHDQKEFISQANLLRCSSPVSSLIRL